MRALACVSRGGLCGGPALGRSRPKRLPACPRSKPAATTPPHLHSLPPSSRRYMDNADSLHDRLELVQTIVETASAAGHEGEPVLQCFF